MLVLLACLGPAISAQNPEKAKAEAALKEFEGYYKEKNVHVRRVAVEGLIGVDHHLVTARLLDVLKDRDASVRKAAVVALATQKNDQGMQELIRRAWYGRNRAERLQILEAFEQSRPKAAETIALELVGSQEWEIRRAAAQLLAHYPDEEGKSVGALLQLLGDKEVLVRLAVMDAFTVLASPRALEGAIKATKDSDWRVQATAVSALRKSRDRAAVQPLIDVLLTAKGRLIDDAHAALVDLTATEWPADGQKWQEWWDRVKVGFKIPTPEEIAARKAKIIKERGSYDPPSGGGKGEYAPYHGIKTRSRQLLFIIDVSSSMAELVTFDQTDQKAVEEFKSRYGDLRVKIDIAREALISLVAELPDFAKFNIITYSGKVDLWQPGLVPADGTFKGKAIKYLARLTPAALESAGRSGQGTTDTCAALEACFGLMGGATQDKNSYKTEADTAFLLTDGMPTSGKFTEPILLIGHVQNLNKKAKMVIHTIGFGSSNKPLLDGIATVTQGQYVKIGI